MHADNVRAHEIEEARRRIDEVRANASDELDLSALDLTEVPEAIVELKLRNLNLSSNRLSAVPDAVCKLISLRYLDLSSNALTLLPEKLCGLSKLEELRAFDNQLTVLPREIGECAALRFLDIHDNDLSELPDSIGQLRHLATLNVANNNLEAFPEAISGLDSLTTLDASLNRITSVEGLCSLLRLQRLFLRGNNLSSIPSCIGQLSHLTRFSAASNHIGVVPDSIGNIRCLRDLYLDGNEITALPESIGNATNLEQLFVNNNRLVILPNKIGQLAKLRDLNVSGNKLKVLPSSLNNLIGLKSLSLEGNDGLGMPADVLIPNRPTAILDYYVRIRSAKRPLNEAKLILVGLGEVGKTSLVNKLIYGTFDENQKETEGVNITDWKVQLRNGEDVRLHVWDFAGQEIKHATHQFFLTKRSLYMLVLNGRQGKEDEDAEYWLSLINSFAEDSPVIVVLNKIRAHPFTVNSRGLQAKFTNVRAFVETDCQDGTGIDDLKAVILGETDRLPDLRKLFPEAWFAIKERLAGMKENFLTFANYREICIANGENDAKAQEDLTFHLHNLGLVLNYGEDARLRDNTVLNPRWVTDGIYKILNAEWLRESKGELRLADIAKILDSEMYPANRHGFLIELMRRFELCFRFTDEDDHYLIADLLDKQEPLETKDFKPSHCLNLALFSKAMHRDRLPLNQ